MSTYPGLFDPSPDATRPLRRYSPLRFLAILVTLTFMAELIVMVVLYYLDLPNYWVASVLDGMLMVILIMPGLYFLQLRPLIQQMEVRVQAEQAHHASEDLLKRVLQVLPVGVWITDKTGRIVHGNPASREIWAGARYVGIDQYQEYKSWWADSGKRIETHEWAGARAISHGETVLDDEVEIENFDGVRKTILNSAVPIYKHNTIQGAVIVNQDITQRKMHEKAIQQKNELLEKFFSGIGTMIAYMDREFNFIRVNDSYAAAAGHPAEFFPGKNHFELYPHPENQGIFERVVTTGEPYMVHEKPFEYTDFPERGVTYWDWNLQPVTGGNGTVEGVVLSLIDVTERKRGELRLAKQNEELRALSIAERRERKMAESLMQASIHVNRSLKLDQVLSSILQQIRQIIRFNGSSIFLLENQTVRLAGYLGFEDDPECIEALRQVDELTEYPPIQAIYETHQPLIAASREDMQEWPLPPELAWVQSYLAVPLITGEEVVGMIDLSSAHQDAFTLDDIKRLIAFAAPAAVAIHNAQLYQAELAARRTAETMSAAARALTQVLEFEHVIDTLLDHIHLVVDSDTAGVTLLEDEMHLGSRTLRGYGKWVERDDLPGFPLDGITDSVIQRLELSQKSLVIPRLQVEEGEASARAGNSIQYWLVTPIIASEKLIGIVELGKASEEIFSRRQVEWAEALVGQAAVAIQNAWLFEQVRSSSERLQALTHKLVEVQENERAYVARELHDEAGQVLSSLKIKLARLEQTAGSGALQRRLHSHRRGNLLRHAAAIGSQILARRSAVLVSRLQNVMESPVHQFG